MRTFMSAEIVDRDNVGVFKLSGSSGFDVEAVDKITAGGRTAGKKFKCNDSIYTELSSFKHNSATAAPDLFK